MNQARQLIAGLLAAYMMTLVFMPCHDTCDSKEHQAVITIQAAQEHHEQDNDICSPFCSCSCCATYITIVHFAGFSAFALADAKTFSLLKQSFVSAFADDCWQPPRLV